MKKRVLPLTSIFLLFLTFSAIVFATTHQETTIVVTTQINPIGPTPNPDFEWNVAVGDSMRYTFTKIFDLNDYDEDGDLYTRTGHFIAENDTIIEMTIRQGSSLFCEILTLDEYATIQLTLDGITFELSGDYGWFITKTTDNRTYWEEYAEQISDEYQNVSVEGDMVVHRTTDNWNDGTSYYISKINWRTGWLSYTYQKETNGTHTIREMEVTSGIPDLIPGFEFSPFPVSGLLPVCCA